MARLFCLLTLLASAVAFGAALTQGERDRALSELHATRKQFLDAVAGLSPAQWNFKPDAKTWSVAEIAEHLALTEDAVFARITRQVLASPAQPGRKPDTARDEQILEGVADRSHQVQTSEALTPKRRWPAGEPLVDHFRQNRDRTIAWVRDTQDDLRAHVAAHPALGELDAYQWVLFLAGHTLRHVRQMDEVKANPNFPKS